VPDGVSRLRLTAHATLIDHVVAQATGTLKAVLDD
jgi:hypothetical protein